MRNDARTFAALIGATSLGLCCGSSGLAAFDPAALVVTSGEIKRLDATHFETRSGELRAQLAAKGQSAAELRFHFLGPTERDIPLASGEIRRQIGIKLRAQDACNVVYAMWHIAPKPRLEISVKSNPSQHRSAECGDRGYHFIRPRQARAVPEIQPDSVHTLRAAIEHNELQVYADGQLSWLGDLPDDAFAFDGPVGVRTDNGVFAVEFRAGSATRP